MENLLDPAVLFFVLGILAGLLRSDLDIPAAIAKFLSLYLLMALGLKGGFALAQAGPNTDLLRGLAGAVLMAIIVPVIGYGLLRRQVSGFDAAALAASFGSVSAVTFLASVQYLETQGLSVGGHMAVAMVLMESPAILFAVLVANALRRVAGAGSAAPSQTSVWIIVRESLTGGTHLLLIGSLAVGWVSGERGRVMMEPFTAELFKGMLALFLLEMGLTVARSVGQVRGQPAGVLAYAALAPVLHALLALAVAGMLGMSAGDAALLMVLSASASYIVVPAVVRHAIPEANPALYCGLPLGVTFPINILLGIPVYAWLARRLLD